jgi:hypothetical protein
MGPTVRGQRDGIIHIRPLRQTRQINGEKDIAQLGKDHGRNAKTYQPLA